MPSGEVPPERQCKATSKQSQERCKRITSPGMEVCYYHGGKTYKGMASPAFKTGRYSRYLPKRLLERYEESLEDERLLEQREEIALVEARIKDLVQRIENGESRDLIRELQKHVDGFIRASQEGKVKAKNEHLAEIVEKVRKAHADYAAWDDVEKWVKVSIRLRESERKRLIEKQQMVTVEELMTLVTALTDVVRKNVTEKEVLGAIQRDFGRLLLASGPVDAGDISPN